MRPGGRLGLTAWGARSNEYRDLWDSLAQAAVGRGLLREAGARAVPWEDWLAQPANIRTAMQQAGLVRVAVDLVTYPVHLTIADFLAIRSNSPSARFIRTVLDADGWRRFQATTEEEFRRRFRDPIDHTRDAWIGIGDSTDTTSADVRAEPDLR